MKCSFLRTLNACECARVCDATDKGQTATAGKPVILEMHQQILQNEEYIKLSSQMKCEDCGLTLYKLEWMRFQAGECFTASIFLHMLNHWYHRSVQQVDQENKHWCCNRDQMSKETLGLKGLKRWNKTKESERCDVIYSVVIESSVLTSNNMYSMDAFFIWYHDLRDSKMLCD